MAFILTNQGFDYDIVEMEMNTSGADVGGVGYVGKLKRAIDLKSLYCTQYVKCKISTNK